MKRTSPISSSPGARLLKLGSLAGGIAAGMAAEGLRQMASGSLPRPRELLLTPKNAARLAERLSDLRGAAMKVGQLLSMEAGDLLPPELSAVLARLREDAHRMPLGQVAAVLNRAWGKQWPERFSRFDFQTRVKHLIMSIFYTCFFSASCHLCAFLILLRQIQRSGKIIQNQGKHPV